MNTRHTSRAAPSHRTLFWSLALSTCTGLLASAPAAFAAEDRARAQTARLLEQAREAGKQVRAELAAPRKIPRRPAPVFRAGAAEIDVTPTKPMYLDGYYNDRLSPAVPGPLTARASARAPVRPGVALLVGDLIAYYHPWVRQVRAQQQAVPPGNVIICTTHTHSAPCMLGVFGPKDAVDMDYVRWVGERMAEAVTKAAASLQPARVGFAEAQLPIDDKGEIPGIARNWHNPGVVDRALLLMRVTTVDGDRPIATVINVGNHPDVLGIETTRISPDFLSYVYTQVTERLGGPTLVFNRALGGVEPIGQGANELDEAVKHMKRIGGIISNHAIEAARRIAWAENPRINLRRSECRFPILSPAMAKELATGRIPVKTSDGSTISEMALVRIGPAQFLTVPGEPHPEVLFKLTDMMTARYRFVLGMAEDEIGYVVPAELYNPKGIQEMLSTGQDNELVVLATAAKLLGVTGFVEPKCIEGMPSKLRR